MINKKRGLLLASFLISVFIIAGVFAETCSIVDEAECSQENTVLKLYQENNTHAEIASLNNSGLALCCDSFYPTNESTGSNKILTLSSSTNAHAGGPDESYGSVEVYFGDYNCNLYENTCDTEYPIELLSLSSPTNAHLGTFNYYPYKLCCKIG